jgi:hypothetical protein
MIIDDHKEFRKTIKKLAVTLHKTQKYIEIKFTSPSPKYRSIDDFSFVGCTNDKENVDY